MLPFDPVIFLCFLMNAFMVFCAISEGNIKHALIWFVAFFASSFCLGYDYSERKTYKEMMKEYDKLNEEDK